jgi:hypothetical protein
VHPWLPEEMSEHRLSAIALLQDDLKDMLDVEEMQQMLGSVLRIIGIKNKLLVSFHSSEWHVLSTEPFKAFESMFFVRRNESMSFPRDESSRS